MKFVSAKFVGGRAVCDNCGDHAVFHKAGFECDPAIVKPAAVTVTVDEAHAAKADRLAVMLRRLFLFVDRKQHMTPADQGLLCEVEALLIECEAIR